MSIWTREKEKQEDITALKHEIKKELIEELKEDVQSMFCRVIDGPDYEDVEVRGWNYSTSITLQSAVKNFRDKLSDSSVQALDESVKSKASELVHGEEFLDALVKRLKDKQL